MYITDLISGKLMRLSAHKRNLQIYCIPPENWSLNCFEVLYLSRVIISAVNLEQREILQMLYQVDIGHIISLEKLNLCPHIPGG